MGKPAILTGKVQASTGMGCLQDTLGLPMTVPTSCMIFICNL